jgi:hypothetical protein
MPPASARLLAVLVVVFPAALVRGQDLPAAAAPAATQAEAEAKYAAAISKRADNILATLKLDNPATARRVHARIVAQYRALRAWHDPNDATIKALRKQATPDAKAQLDALYATLKPIHDSFLADLAADLSAGQIDLVKDGMTFDVLNVTYSAYTDMIPTLTDEQKAYIRRQLVEARDIAMSEGSSEAKHAVFGKYKGRINTYLSKAGYDLKKEEKAWQERLRARRAADAATRPAS